MSVITTNFLLLKFVSFFSITSNVLMNTFDNKQYTCKYIYLYVKFSGVDLMGQNMNENAFIIWGIHC